MGLLQQMKYGDSEFNKIRAEQKRRCFEGLGQKTYPLRHQDHNLPGHFELDSQDRPTRWVPDPFTPERCRLWWKRADLYMILFTVLCGITAVALQYWGLKIK